MVREKWKLRIFKFNGQDALAKCICYVGRSIFLESGIQEVAVHSMSAQWGKQSCLQAIMLLLSK